jgi:hypothetical protein
MLEGWFPLTAVPGPRPARGRSMRLQGTYRSKVALSWLLPPTARSGCARWRVSCALIQRQHARDRMSLLRIVPGPYIQRRMACAAIASGPSLLGLRVKSGSAPRTSSRLYHQRPHRARARTDFGFPRTRVIIPANWTRQVRLGRLTRPLKPCHCMNDLDENERRSRSHSA